MDSATAKQFLISRIVDEAKFEEAPLSEVERKMLYFTEVHPSLPDIYEVNQSSSAAMILMSMRGRLRASSKELAITISRNRMPKRDSGETRLMPLKTKIITCW